MTQIKNPNHEQREASDTPLALYVHIPFCTAKCRYCGFYSEPIANYDSGRLVSAILKEMSRYDLGRAVRTVYIGGGSPSCLPERQLLQLVRECPTAEEFTIEVNPGQVNEKMLGQLRQELRRPLREPQVR